MPNINWEMMTQFIFPEELGIAEEVVSVNVIPRWQQIETDESVRLTGIYHIMATVRFNPSVKVEYSEGTFIEHLDLNGDEGYFEYAMPLEVDLPREKVAIGNQPALTVDDISFFVYDGSSCTFKWEVKCKFEEPVEGALFQVESEPEKELVEQAVATVSQTAEVAKETNVEPPPLSLEQQLVNEVLQQSIESSSKDLQVAKEETTFEHNEVFPEVLHLPTYESPTNGPHLAPFENEKSNILEEAKTIRKETEKAMQKIDQSSNQVVDNQWTLPSDADDFYNELSESYSLLKFR